MSRRPLRAFFFFFQNFCRSCHTRPSIATWRGSSHTLPPMKRLSTSPCSAPDSPHVPPLTPAVSGFPHHTRIPACSTPLPKASPARPTFAFMSRPRVDSPFPRSQPTTAQHRSGVDRAEGVPLRLRQQQSSFHPPPQGTPSRCLSRSELAPLDAYLPDAVS